jgi:hypothetical protein
MAGFHTHLSGAALVSGTAAVTSLLVGWVTEAQAPLLFIAGIVGGILPDIDAKDSIPVRVFFTLLALLAAASALFRAAPLLSLVESLLLGGFAYWWIRYPISAWFLRYTVHRGVFHSLLAVLFFTALTAALVHRLGGGAPLLSWLVALALGVGYLTHLCLDELASLDPLRLTVKGSFGTALKPCSWQCPWASLLLLGASGCAVLAAPDPRPLWRGLPVAATVERLSGRLLPAEGQWFRALLPH